MDEQSKQSESVRGLQKAGLRSRDCAISPSGLLEKKGVGADDLRLGMSNVRDQESPAALRFYRHQIEFAQAETRIRAMSDEWFRLNNVVREQRRSIRNYRIALAVAVLALLATFMGVQL